MKLPAAWVGQWQRLQPRERHLLGAAALVVGLALAWLLAVAPALRTIGSATQRLDLLDAQLERVQRLAARARQLQTRPAVSRADALRTLEASLRQRLGDSAQMSLAGDAVTVTLRGAAPQSLAPWLGQVRSMARVAVLQARLNHGPRGWDGSIVLQLPGQ